MILKQLLLFIFFCYWPEREVKVSLSILQPADTVCRAHDEGCMNLSDMTREMI